MNDVAEVNRLLWPVTSVAFFPGVGLLVRCQMPGGLHMYW